MSICHTFRLDYDVQLYHASLLLAHHGEAFCSEAVNSKTLTDRLNEEISNSFDSFTKDTFEMLTDFICRESWTRLDLSLEDMGG